MTARGRAALLAAAVTAASVAAALPARAGTHGATASGLARTAPLSSFFSNAGISDDANPGAANLDGSGSSFSAEQLAAVGWAPGLSFALPDGATVQVPNLAPGQPDNALASGQT